MSVGASLPVTQYFADKLLSISLLRVAQADAPFCPPCFARQPTTSSALWDVSWPKSLVSITDQKLDDGQWRSSASVATSGHSPHLTGRLSDTGTLGTDRKGPDCTLTHIMVRRLKEREESRHTPSRGELERRRRMMMKAVGLATLNDHSV